MQRQTLQASAALCVALLFLAACGGGSGGDSGSAPQGISGFTLQSSTSTIAVLRDSRGLLRVRIERQTGLDGEILLRIADPPAGVDEATVIVEAHETEAQLPLDVGPEVPLGHLSLVITGSGSGTTKSTTVQLDVQAAQPRSQELIQAALEAGQIDLGTSLLYRAYAVFGDARLPEGFVGSGPKEEDAALFIDIEQKRAVLAQAILDQLRPFLLRPDDPQSVFNAGQPAVLAQSRVAAAAVATPAADPCLGPFQVWVSLKSAVYPVRAWALCTGTDVGNARAQKNIQKIITVVDNVYGLMVALMGPAKADLLGNDAIDVYVVPPNANAPREDGDYSLEKIRGVTIPTPPFVKDTSSAYVMMPTRLLAESQYPFTLIHELFHVLQFAHSTALFATPAYWFTEASAEWAAVHFNRLAPNPPANQRTRHIQRFTRFQKPGHSLFSTVNHNAYQSYIWPFFMEQEKGENLIANAWTQFEGVSTHEGATNVLNSLLPFKDNFHKFALRNVNEPLLPGDPVFNRYKYLDDQFPDKNTPKYESLFLFANSPLTQPLYIAPLQAKYFLFTYEFVTEVLSVEFDFSGVEGREHLNVDALIFGLEGWVPKPVALDNESRPRFCFERGPSTETVRGSFVELRLVLSNHTFAVGDFVTGSMIVKASSHGCADWSGTFRTTRHVNTGVIIVDESSEATVTYVVDESIPSGAGSFIYKVQSGQVSFRNEYITRDVDAITTGKTEMLPDATSGSGATTGGLLTFPIPEGIVKYHIFGSSTIVPSVDQDSRTSDVVIWWHILPEPAGGYTLKNDGTLMEEDITVQEEFGSSRHQWSLTKIEK